MSSAILYLAIIAIWACVLIPRWLRRDSARGSSHSLAAVVTAGPASYASGASPVSDASDASDEEILDEDVPVEFAGADDRPDDFDSPTEASPPPPLTREESRQRMMAARRRLLGMLVALEAAAVALAVMGLAALWVVIPPSVMFAGYLLLLREAAHADAEEALRAEAAWEHARAQERARARATAASAAAPAAASAVPAAPVRPAARFEDSGPGRDFAPGLAGKYTTSTAEAEPATEPAEEAFYDQYTQNRLRAVGD